MLFDVDGTLLNADGQGRAAMESGLSAVTQGTILAEGIDFGGRTDRGIIRSILERNGHPLETSGVNMERAISAFIDAALCDWDDSRVQALPGAIQLVQRLHRNQMLALGLVTGNVRRVAELKLDSIGLLPFFAFGAFGDEHEERVRLVDLAIERASDRYCRCFTPEDVCIVGDTTRDIDAAFMRGTSCVAVATGLHTVDELADLAPTALFDSLAEVALVENAILDAVGLRQ